MENKLKVIIVGHVGSGTAGIAHRLMIDKLMADKSFHIEHITEEEFNLEKFGANFKKQEKFIIEKAMLDDLAEIKMVDTKIHKSKYHK